MRRASSCPSASPRFLFARPVRGPADCARGHNPRANAHVKVPEFEFPTVADTALNVQQAAALTRGGEEDDALREAGSIDADTTRSAGVVLDAVDVPSFQDAAEAGAAFRFRGSTWVRRDHAGRIRPPD